MRFFSNQIVRQLALAVLVACAVSLPVYGADGAILRHWPIAAPQLTRLLELTGAIAFGYLLAASIHAIGQLAASKLIGWDVYLLGIWPFLVRFEPFAVRRGGVAGKWTLFWVMAFPPAPEKQTKWRVAIFNFGGPAANLVAIAVVVMAHPVAPHSPLVKTFVLPLLLLWFLLATLPLQGTQKNTPLSGFGIARLRALGLYVSGITPDLWDPALVATLESVAESGVGETDAELRSTDIYLYERYFALEEYKKARQALDRAIARTQPSERMWDGICIEDAFFSAFIERDIARAEQALAKTHDRKLRKYDTYARALAAIAIARGDGAEALRLLRRRPWRDRNPFLRDWWRRGDELVIREAQRLAANRVTTRA